ncbi:membrane protein [soil metagenome]
MSDEDRNPLALASKVPAATAYFWIIKILTTGMGETTSDFLLHSVHPRAAAVLAVGLTFAAAVAVQIISRRYHAGRYWMVVVLVAVFGTMVADVIDFIYHVPLGPSTAVFAALVGAVLLAWWLTERTLSIHSIVSRRREGFYWATVFLTFVLGTAAGDLTADTLELGFLGSGIVFLGMILVPLLAHRLLKVNEVLCFWVAYILTRPLGASFADWMSAPHSRNGLGLGPLKVSVIWASAIAAMVVWMAMRRSQELPTLESPGDAPGADLSS